MDTSPTSQRDDALRAMMVLWFGNHTWYDERKWETMRQLYAVAAKAARREALEEAAKVCEAIENEAVEYGEFSNGCGEAVRALIKP